MRLFSLVLGALIVLWLSACALVAAERPRLIVAISVDQLCQDYLIRFGDNFASDGFFRRVEREGAAFAQCHHRHAFTVTGPGHAVQLTGTYPNQHGIVGNQWFDRLTGKDVYCCDDPSVQLIGLPDAKGVSPRKLLVETTGDIMKLASGNRSKVFGVAIKDRVAMLMAGHNADAAFWLEDKANAWITSTYYRQDLPGYLRVFNMPLPTERFRAQSWELLLPKEKYHNTGPDKNSWENPPKGFTSEFPHALPGKGDLKPADFAELALRSPFGNEVTLEAARAIVAGEDLGKDEITDLLCINLSANDFVGHDFGPHSLEVEDMTYRTDRQLGDFLRFLDEQVGAAKWTLLLTADHGVAPVVEYAQQFRLPAKRSPLGKTDEVKAKLEARLRERLGAAGNAPGAGGNAPGAAGNAPGAAGNALGAAGNALGPVGNALRGVPVAADKPLVQKVEDYQVFLQKDHPLLAGDGFFTAQTIVRDWLLEQPYVVAAFTRDDLIRSGNGKLFGQVQRTFHPQRSGDVLFVLAPYTVPGAKGTTHGSPWHYDTHVPLLLIGCGVRAGHFVHEVSPAAVASTVAELARVDYPSANAEPPLRDALK